MYLGYLTEDDGRTESALTSKDILSLAGVVFEQRQQEKRPALQCVVLNCCHSIEISGASTHV